MKNSKTLVIVVIALIAVNCLLMCTLWYNNYRPETPPPPTGSAFDYLTQELKLTPAQVKQYSALRDQHFTFTSKVNQEMRMARDSFFDNLSNPTANPAEVNQIEARILTRQQMLDTATFYHFRKLRAILTPGQQEKFDDVIQNVLHMMAGPHGPEGQGQHPGQQQAGPPPAGAQGGRPQEPPPFNGRHRRPGMRGPQGGPPPSYGRPGGPGPGFGPGRPDGPPPQGPPPPDGPPPGPPQ